jgi:hypothetical protein
MQKNLFLNVQKEEIKKEKGTVQQKELCCVGTTAATSLLGPLTCSKGKNLN